MRDVTITYLFIRYYDVTLTRIKLYHLHLSRSLVDRWGTTDDLATSSLHSSRLSAFLMATPSVMQVHSGMLSSHLFFGLSLLLPPCIVPCRVVLASPGDLITCTYNFRFFSENKCYIKISKSGVSIGLQMNCPNESKSLACVETTATTLYIIL